MPLLSAISSLVCWAARREFTIGTDRLGQPSTRAPVRRLQDGAKPIFQCVYLGATKILTVESPEVLQN